MLFCCGVSTREWDMHHVRSLMTLIVGGYLDPGPPARLQWPGAGQNKGAVLRDLGLAGEVVKGEQGGRGRGWHLLMGDPGTSEWGDWRLTGGLSSSAAAFALLLHTDIEKPVIARFIWKEIKYDFVLICHLTGPLEPNPTSSVSIYGQCCDSFLYWMTFRSRSPPTDILHCVDLVSI